jgi:exodeoxyribonuclease VII small subunit
MSTTKTNLNNSLKKLADIVQWFENQQQVDVEEGLEKVKEGAKLVKLCRERLKEIENEFEEVKKEIESVI